METNKDFVYIVYDEDRGTMTVFHSKRHAIQYMVKKVKEWGHHYLDDEDVENLMAESEDGLNEIFFDFFIYREEYIID